MNRIILMGNLTRDVEVKHVSDSSAVSSFGIAVNRKWKNAAGEPQEEVCFLDCEAWGKTGDIIAKFFVKGARILIEGRIKQDTWEDKETKAKRSKHKVVVDNFHFVDAKKDGTAKLAPAGVAAADDPETPF